MKKFVTCLCSNSSCTSKNMGLFVLRVGIGIIFVLHGYPKIIAGPTMWAGLGTGMNFFGITFMPVMWGCAAACSEFFGGIALIVGLGTRVASFFLACTMIVATSFHLTKGGPFSSYSHPLSLLIVFASLILMGGGALSCDNCLTKNQ